MDKETLGEWSETYGTAVVDWAARANEWAEENRETNPVAANLLTEAMALFGVEACVYLATKLLAAEESGDEKE